MPEQIKCKVCGKTFRVKDFADQMQKIRHHYKVAHPRLWAKAIRWGAEKRKAK